MEHFTTVTPLRYVKTQWREYIWSSADNNTGFLAGTLLGSEIVRVRFLRGSHRDATRYQLADGGEDTLPYHSWMVTRGDEQWPDVGDENDSKAMIEPYLQGFAFSATHLRLSRPLTTNERIFGLGERTGTMNKRGQAFPVWNIDFPGRHSDDVISMYTSIPFYTGIRAETGRAYGVLIDATGQIDADLGKSDPNAASMTVEGDSLVVYFFRGPTPADVLRQYTDLTGRMPLPARWTLGHHQCRWSYVSEQQVNEIADTLREHHHPCDGIWLDIDYMHGFRNFTWDPQRFPNPQRLAQKLHAQGFHLVTILDPGTKVDEQYSIYTQGMQADYFCRFQNGEPYIGNVWPGACVFPDFSQQAVRSWWGDQYKELLASGVDGIWNDMDEPAITKAVPEQDTKVESYLEEKEVTVSDTEQKNAPESFLWGNTMAADVLHRAGGEQPTGPDGPALLHTAFHNAYGLQMARTTYEGLLRLQPDTRPFVLTRSGTGGVQRYAAVWTGDNNSEWKHILLAIKMCLNLGMSGVAFVGADIGGFWDDCDGELLTRFVQLGAFLPFSRNHNAAETHSQEPWAFGEPYESAYRKAIETRYRFLPYLYTLFQQSSKDGAPIMRPLYYHYPQDEQACDTQTEFLVGDALLSAPIYESGATSRSVYLPEGLWFDYWEGTEYPGGTTHEAVAPLERWPLFVRSNSILPTGPVIEYVDQHPSDPLTFTCYMGTDGLANYTLYEDDGHSQAYMQGAFALTSVSCRVDEDEITVRIEEQHEGYKPLRTGYDIVVYIGNRVLQQHVKAGQGTVILKLHA